MPDRRLIDAALDCIVSFDAAGRVLEWNAAAEQLFGYTRAEVVGRELAELVVSPESRAEYHAVIGRLEQAPGRMAPVELTAMTASGTRIQVELSITVLRGVIGTQTVFTAFIRDVSLLRGAQQRAAALRLISSEASAMTDLPRIATSAALYVCQVLGAESCALLHAESENRWVVLAGAGDVEEGERCPDLLAAGDGVEHIPVQTTDDSSWVLAIRRKPATVPEAGSMDFLHDVAFVLGHALERDLAGDRLLREALRDATTGLPTRVLLLDRLESALARGASAAPTAVIVLGVERFDAVRESVGHEAAEDVLRTVAVRLRAAVGRGDTLARIGDDEFAIVCEPADDGGRAITLAAQLLAAVAGPVFADEQELALTAGAGIAFAAPGASPTSLVRNASVALQRARRGGRSGGGEVFDASMRTQLADRLTIESDLRQGIERGELRIAFQPLVSLLDRTVVGVEALVRWAHPTRGLIPPDQFLSIAEQSGQITAIGAWILGTACRQAATWAAAYPDHEPPTMTVNVSTRQLTDPEFVRLVTDRLDATGMRASQLVLDITEGAFHDDPSVPEVLLELEALGVGLFLDDFLTGNAALTWLTRFPLTGLKLEAPFVRGLGADPKVRRLLEAVCRMAAAFDLAVVAEGVESEEQVTILEGLGCEVAQGYLFSRPVPAAQLEGMLATALPRVSVATTEGPAAASASVTMRDAAGALGVSSSTVRRWADEGRLTAIRTSGGHRRFLVEDVRRLRSGLRESGTRLRGVQMPDHALPRAASLLRERRLDVASAGLAATYEARSGGWFAEPEGRAHVERWLLALSEALATGTYEPAVEATAALARRAALGGVPTAERVTFVDRSCTVLLRLLESDDGSAELAAARRVCAVLRQQALEDVS
jgi:PAS domain S-box-containing protein/diguanylate cyclase (GGDEF)-like protein/excisionase family DNA binding protein